MTWAKLDDNTFDSPAMLALERSHRLVAIEALTWACRQLTDGAIPRAALRRLTDDPDPDAAAAALVAAGVWTPTEEGWEIAGFTAQQSTADEVRESRERARLRMKRFRQHVAGEHKDCDPKRCGYAARSREHNGERTQDRSSPTRPDPTEREGGKESRKRSTAARSLPGGRSRRGPAARPLAIAAPRPRPLKRPDVDELLERWAEAYTDAPAALSPLLRVCRPLVVEGARLTLGFPENAFLMEKAKQRHEAIEEHLGVVFGLSWSVDFIHATERSTA